MTHKQKTFALLFAYLVVLFDINLNFVNGLSQQEIDNHLEMGKKLLAAGQLADALTHYHSAIDGDPKNYMSYFRRATVYLAMGRSKSALQDLNQVVELKPDFSAARMQRANVLLKQGDFKGAEDDYKFVVKEDASNSEARAKIETILSIVTDLDRARAYMDNHDFGSAIELLNRGLDVCPWSTELHELRSDCYLSVGDVSKAINDINALSKLIPDNTKAFYKLSELHYTLGDADASINNIRECLKLDPDHKMCSTLYKKLKKLVKLIETMKKSSDEQRYDECVKTAKQIIESDTSAINFKQKAESYICSCNSKAKNSKDAIEACTNILRQSPSDVEALLNRAQAYFVEERLEEAQHDCSKALESEDSQRTRECVDRAQKLIKQSKKRDYYKILGVKRSASKKEILKAYRKMAQEWHPDRYSDRAEKEAAQKKFIDIAAAKEVLTDAEKRAKFDNGEDPLDAEEQAQQGHHGFNPFGQGFNPFGNGNFHFKFKFN